MGERLEAAREIEGGTGDVSGEERPKPQLYQGCLNVLAGFFIIFLVLIAVWLFVRTQGCETIKESLDDTAPSSPQLAPVFDVPRLLKMTYAEVRSELGTPSSFFAPTAAQVEKLPQTRWTYTYNRGSTSLQIDYYRTGRVVEMFLEDNTQGRTAEQIRQLGNLRKDSKDYYTFPQPWINPTLAKKQGKAQVAGIHVLP